MNVGSDGDGESVKVHQLCQMHPPVGGVDGGAALHVWGPGKHGKSLYLPLNVAVSLKLP